MNVLIRVLQKNRTHGIYIHRERENEIYYTKLAHMTLESEKSNTLSSSGLRLKKADDVV